MYRYHANDVPGAVDFLKRYSLFPFNPAPRPPSPQEPSGPTGTAFSPDGSLTPIGELYRYTVEGAGYSAAELLAPFLRRRRSSC